MKFLAWNILHGGGARRMPQIALAVVDHGPDVAVLTEFRSSTGGQVRAALADHGWTHQVCADPPRGCNGILIASRVPLEPLPEPEAPGRPRAADRRIIRGRLRDRGLTVIAVHIPPGGPGQETARAWVWRDVLRHARAARDGPCIILGDFNTGRHRADEDGATFTHTASLGKLASLGYADAWRTLHPGGREPTWVSHAGAGFRIDHAFLSRPLGAGLREARYSHRERDLRISDHSVLLVEVDEAPPTGRALPSPAVRGRGAGGPGFPAFFCVPGDAGP